MAVRAAIALGVASCASHASDDADTAPDATSDASIDAPTPTDAGVCGSAGQPCSTDTECTTGLRCAQDLPLDAGVAGLCLPLSRGSCGGLAGELCPVETDECVATSLADDLAFCFEPAQLRCLCAWPPFAEWYHCP